MDTRTKFYLKWIEGSVCNSSVDTPRLLGSANFSTFLPIVPSTLRNVHQFLGLKLFVICFDERCHVFCHTPSIAQKMSTPGLHWSWCCISLLYCNIVSFISLVLYSLDVIIWKKKMSKYLLQMAWKSINEPIKCTKWIEIVWRIVTPEKCITNDFHQSAKSISLLNVMANQRRTMKWVSMLAQQRGKKLFNEIIKMVSQNNIVHRMEVAPREPFNLHTNPFG